MNLEPYQTAAIAALSSVKNGIVKAPAGAGKTWIGAGAIKLFSHARVSPPKVAIIANTTEQVGQWKKAVKVFPWLGNSTVSYFCYAGCPALAGYDLVLFDECHHLPAPEFRKCLTYHEGARWGVSATPDRADDLKADLYKLIGPIVYEVSREDVKATGRITEARVFIHHPNVKGEMEKEVADTAAPIIAVRQQKWPYLFKGSPRAAEEQIKRVIWQVCLDLGIERNQRKNSKVIALANEHLAKGDSVLLLIGKIEHGQALAEHIPGAVVVFSKMGAKKRREAIEAFGKGEIRCMIATSLADEGLDVPRANVLIQAGAGRSAAKAEQRTGRVLRAFKDAHTGEAKEHGIIHDFSDLHHYFLASQSRRRIAVYESLGYQIFNR